MKPHDHHYPSNMRRSRFYIGPESTGIVTCYSVQDALRTDGAPEHRASEYEEVSQQEYEETVLDLRYEGGSWFQ